MRGWFSLAGLMIACVVASAAPLTVIGKVTDTTTGNPGIAGVKLEISDDAKALTSATSDSAGNVSLTVSSFSGTHVYCSFSSPLYDPVKVSKPVRDGKVDCSVQMTQPKGIALKNLTVDNDGTSLIVRAHVFNEATTVESIDRFEVAGIWKSEQNCSDELPPDRYDVSLDKASMMVAVADKLQALTVNGVLKMHIAQNKCKNTCIHFAFQPSMRMAANSDRAVQFSIARKVIESNKIILPEGTHSAFRLVAGYQSRTVTAETEGQATTADQGKKLLTILTDDPDCGLPQ